MKCLDLTFPTPSANLACDEALLEWCENGHSDEVLRFWEPQDHFVVLGTSNKWRLDVDASACKELSIPILRRTSGGGAVLQGPGCLNFSLILKTSSPFLSGIHTTNGFVMRMNKEALEQRLGIPACVQGTSDLTVESLKISGNAQRRKRHFVLFHGSFLLNLDLLRVEKTLPIPLRQPAYRLNRPHKDFLLNLLVSPAAIKQALREKWNAVEPLTTVPFQQIDELAGEKYSAPEWNLKL